MAAGGCGGLHGGCRGLRPRRALLTLEKALEKEPVERLVIAGLGGAVRLGGAGGGPLWKESASGSAGTALAPPSLPPSVPAPLPRSGGGPSLSKDGFWPWSG